MGALDCVKSAEGMKATESTEVFTISSTNLNETRRDLESQFSKTNSTSKHSVCWTFSIDIPLYILVLTLVGLFELDVIPTFKSGFFCKDPALSYTFYGDTVSAGMLVSTVLLLPIVVIFPTELIFLDNDYLQRSKVYQAIRNTLWLYRSYMYGMNFNFCIVEVMKCVIGNPRPSFFHLCNPVPSANCTANEYISSFTCTSSVFSAWTQNDASHSFPSGHTSLSVYCGFFLAWYLQRRAFSWHSRTILLVPVLQFALATYAAICSLTRITDHRHHWWDVLAGSVVGLLTLLYSVLVLCDNFSYASAKSLDVISDKGLQSTTLLYDNQRPNIHLP